MNKKVLGIVLGVVAVVVVVLAVVLCGCCGSSKSKPSNAVVELIDSLKNGDFEKTAEYAADGTMGNLDLDEDNQSLEIVKLYFKNLEAKVIDEKVDGNEAVATVEVTNKDLGKILELYLNKALEIAMANLNEDTDAQAIQDELMDYFKKLFDSDEVDYTTTSVEVKLTKVDGSWKVVVDEQLRDAILPGLAKIADQISDSAEEAE